MKLYVILSLFVLFCGCAYFNTLYNGRQAYDRAYEKEQELLAQGYDSADVAEETDEDYQRAVEKADKVFGQYPGRERFHDDAHFLRATASFRLRNYHGAIGSLRALQDNFPQSPYIPQSWLFLARSYEHLENYSRAREAYEYVKNNYPELNKNDQIDLYLADVVMADKGRGQAIEFLENAYATAETEGQKMYLINRISRYYAELELYDDALEWIDKLPAFNSDFASIFYECEKRKVEILMERGDYESARTLLSQLRNRDEYINRENELDFLLASVLHKTGSIDDAYDLYREITFTETVNEFLARSWYAMSQISIEERGEYDTGKSELQEALAYAEEPLRGRIKKRLDGLERIDEYEMQMADDDEEKTSFTKYRIGETYWLDARLPQKALDEFEELLRQSDLPDSIKKVTLYSTALIYRDINNDTLTSDSLLKQLIEQYPSAEVSKQAQNIMGEDVTVETRRDSAQHRFTRAERQRLRSSEYSEEAYYNYILTATMYSDIDTVAAKALFAAARYVGQRPTRRDGQVDTVAAKIFNTLCDKYSESEQCEEAQEFLQIGAVKSFLADYTDRAEEEEDETDPLDGEEAKAEKEERESEDGDSEYEIPDFTNWF
ncbi:MAG: tetratricopeptide repeat protein [Fibrobacterota bacterium]